MGNCQSNILDTGRATVLEKRERSDTEGWRRRRGKTGQNWNLEAMNSLWWKMIGRGKEIIGVMRVILRRRRRQASIWENWSYKMSQKEVKACAVSVVAIRLHLPIP